MNKKTKKSKCFPKSMLTNKINFDMAKIRTCRKCRKSFITIKTKICFQYWKRNVESKSKLDRINNYKDEVVCILHNLIISYQKKKLVLAEKSPAVARYN